MKTFLTSDHHFYHNNIIDFCDRPFNSVREMNQELIRKWNDKVNPGDLVFHLGDFAFSFGKGIRKIKDQLNGSIILIPGNHDKRRVMRRCNFTVADQYIIRLNNLILTHMPLKRVHSNGLVNVHGHIHNRMARGKRINVCVEWTNYAPVEIEKVIKQAKTILRRNNG